MSNKGPQSKMRKMSKNQGFVSDRVFTFERYGQEIYW